MFLSWLGQNLYQSQMDSRKSEIDSRVNFCSAEMSKALQWMLAYQTEIRKEKADSEIMINTGLGYAQTVGDIVHTVEQIDPSSAVLMKHSKDFLKQMDSLRAAAKKADLQEFREGTALMMYWFRSIDSEAYKVVNAKAGEVASGQSKAKWIFIAFFIAGSLMYGVTWCRINFASTNEPDA